MSEREKELPVKAMMRWTSVLAVIAVVCSATAIAGTKEKVYPVPADVLYEAAVETAAEMYHLDHSSAAKLQFGFVATSIYANNGFRAEVAVQSISDTSSRLIIDVAKGDSKQLFAWGGGGRVADQFRKSVEAKVSSWHAVDYKLTLVKPKVNTSLTYEDELLSVTFALSRKHVKFLLRNNADSPLKIDWNQWAYVDVDGKSHKVFHQEIAYVDRQKSLAPSLIPPTASLEDVILPSDYTDYRDIGGGFHEEELLPAKHATEFVGKTFSLFMPVESDGRVKNYLFTFKVEGAQQHK